MNIQPKNNEAVQRSGSVGKGFNVRKGARNRVRKAVSVVKKYNLPIKSVLVVGPQHGYEPEKFTEMGIKNVSVEVVGDFVNDCRGLGLECLHSAIEDIEPIHVDGVYASHCLEHTYDITQAISVIKECAQSWVYVAVPITPEGEGPTIGHLTPIRNKKKLIKLFEPWKCKIIKKTKSTFIALFIK